MSDVTLHRPDALMLSILAVGAIAVCHGQAQDWTPVFASKLLQGFLSG